MKYFITLIITISILDIQGDPNHVLVQACKELTCINVTIETKALQDDQALEALGVFIGKQLNAPR